MDKKPEKNASISSFHENSEVSIHQEKPGEPSHNPAGLNHTRTNQTDQKYSIATSAYDAPRKVVFPPNKQMSRSDQQSFDHGTSLKELSPTSPLKKMMGTISKVGKGIGSLGNKSLNMIGNALKLKELGKGLGIVSKGLGLNMLGKGLGAVGKHGLKQLNNLSKGLGLDSLGKGLNSLSRLGLDQLGKGLKDISKGLNLRKLQENLKKMALISDVKPGVRGLY